MAYRYKSRTSSLVSFCTQLVQYNEINFKDYGIKKCIVLRDDLHNLIVYRLKYANKYSWSQFHYVTVTVHTCL